MSDLVGTNTLYTMIKRFYLSSSKSASFDEIYTLIESEIKKTSEYQNTPFLIKARINKSWLINIFNRLIARRQLKKKLIALDKAKINSLISQRLYDIASLMYKQQLWLKIKIKLNKLPLFNFSLMKPKALTININAFPSFFLDSDTPHDFGNVTCEIPHHLSSLDRNFGNKNFFIYFSRNFNDDYFFSINAPLSFAAKQKLTNHVIENISHIIQTNKG